MDPSRAGSSNENLFPNKVSFLIFWAYITLFVSQGLLVTLVQRGPISGNYAPIIVLLTELAKLSICIGVYLFRSGGSWTALLHDVKSNQKLLLLYMVPALLYCWYNNLTFVNLRLFDVSTYYCLMQFRIVLTAIIYQCLFKRQLNVIQWTSLLILTTGCIIKEYGMFNDKVSKSEVGHKLESTTIISADINLNESLPSLGETGTSSQTEQSRHKPGFEFFLSTGLILLQMFCSCFAGVYNEYLLKDSSVAKNSDVILQNIFMYVDSIVCNLVLFGLSGKSDSHPGDVGIATLLGNLLTSPLVLILVINNALAGLVASLFLKNLNSILKTFASALELFAVTFLAWILFGNLIDSHTVIALILVSLATIIYSSNPVSVAPPDHKPKIDNREGFVRLPMNDD